MAFFGFGKKKGAAVIAPDSGEPPVNLAPITTAEVMARMSIPLLVAGEPRYATLLTQDLFVQHVLAGGGGVLIAMGSSQVVIDQVYSAGRAADLKIIQVTLATPENIWESLLWELTPTSVLVVEWQLLMETELAHQLERGLPKFLMEIGLNRLGPAEVENADALARTLQSSPFVFALGNGCAGLIGQLQRDRSALLSQIRAAGIRVLVQVPSYMGWASDSNGALLPHRIASFGNLALFNPSQEDVSMLQLRAPDLPLVAAKVPACQYILIPASLGRDILRIGDVL